jgi:hypothetical protein
VTGKHDLIMVFKNAKAGEENLFTLAQVMLGK